MLIVAPLSEQYSVGACSCLQGSNCALDAALPTTLTLRTRNSGRGMHVCYVREESCGAVVIILLAIQILFIQNIAIPVQWNLSKMITLGSKISGCNREVAI